jgi:hypothetical protein
VQLKNNEIKFHVFVDQLSVEVFVNDGDVVLTSLMFPNPYFQKGIEAFSENAASVLKEFNAWELKSIWEKDTSTGLMDFKNNENGSIRLYPNPAKDRISIQLPTNTGKNSILKIFNIQGIEVKTESQFPTGNLTSIDISDFQNGYYMVQVITGTQRYSQSFIKIN